MRYKGCLKLLLPMARRTRRIHLYFRLPLDSRQLVRINFHVAIATFMIVVLTKVLGFDFSEVIAMESQTPYLEKNDKEGNDKFDDE